MKGFKRITFDANIMGGQACIRGMRIPVSLVVNLIAYGMTTDEIIKEYPDLAPSKAFLIFPYRSPFLLQKTQGLSGNFSTASKVL